MGVWSWWFGKKEPEPQPQRQPAPEDAVIVHFQYGSTDLQPLFALEDRLAAAIDAAGTGQYDGHEIAVDGGDGFLFMYGPNADALFEAVRPILEACDFARGASVILRRVTAGDAETETETKIAG